MKNITNKLHTWSCLPDGKQQLPYCSIWSFCCLGEKGGSLAGPDRCCSHWPQDHGAAAAVRKWESDPKCPNGCVASPPYSLNISCFRSFKQILCWSFFFIFHGYGFYWITIWFVFKSSVFFEKICCVVKTMSWCFYTCRISTLEGWKGCCYSLLQHPAASPVSLQQLCVFCHTFSLSLRHSWCCIQ